MQPDYRICLKKEAPVSDRAETAALPRSGGLRIPTVVAALRLRVPTAAAEALPPQQKCRSHIRMVAAAGNEAANSHKKDGTRLWRVLKVHNVARHTALPFSRIGNEVLPFIYR